jgi:hypothetical protein
VKVPHGKEDEPVSSSFFFAEKAAGEENYSGILRNQIGSRSRK